MSLQLAAQHLAEHGRGDDKMLVHMTPKEVSGLQHLAQMHGGSLTTNPHTGLPEAGFLDSIMPTIIGAGLTYFSGGTINPMMAAGIVGGVQAARTGDISKGLLAGLGAYGGGSLTGGLMGAGAAAEGLGAQAAANMANEAAGLTGASANQAVQQAVTDKMANLTSWDKLSSGVSNLGNEQGRNLAMNALGGGMGAVKTGLAAATPILADQMVQTTTPAPTNKPEIHPFRYAGGRYERLPAVDANIFKGFADGGMAQDNSTGMFNYAHMQPAVDLNSNIGTSPTNMAEGGRIEDGVHRFDIGGEAAAQLQSAYQGGANDLQAMVNNYGVTQADVEKYFPGFDVAGAGLTLPGQPAVAPAAAPAPVEDNWTPSLTPIIPSPPTQPASAAPAVIPAAAPAASAITDQQVLDWFKANPKASDYTISQAMSQYGVSPEQVARVTTTNPADVVTRLGLVNTISAEGNLLKAPPQNNPLGSQYDQSWAKFMDSQLNAGKDKATAIMEMARVTGIPESEIAARYAAAEEILNPVKIVPPIKPIGGAITGLGGLNTALPAATPALSTTPTGISGATSAPTSAPTYTPGGMGQLVNTYTAGGGHTGPDNLYVPKSVEELNAKYPVSGGTKQVLDYLSGKTTENPMLHPYTPEGRISKDYATSVLGYPEQDTSQKVYLFDPNTKKYIRNPDYIPTTYDPTSGSKVYGKSLNQIRVDMSTLKSDADWLNYMNTHHIEPQQIADATGISLGEVLQHIQAAQGNAKTSNTSSSDASIPNGAHGGEVYAANGGEMYASGGIGDLGSYSDGGRLLRGPGDGVSDSIPATIGKGRPARLADGEFVVPARIVSELGNGSTEAGARKLYDMMDRVQATRGKTIGKGKVATNTRADKFLPA
jgi:hypothetical protein